MRHHLPFWRISYCTLPPHSDSLMTAICSSLHSLCLNLSAVEILVFSRMQYSYLRWKIGTNLLVGLRWKSETKDTIATMTEWKLISYCYYNVMTFLVNLNSWGSTRSYYNLAIWSEVHAILYNSFMKKMFESSWWMRRENINGHFYAIRK